MKRNEEKLTLQGRSSNLAGSYSYSACMCPTITPTRDESKQSTKYSNKTVTGFIEHVCWCYSGLHE